MPTDHNGARASSIRRFYLISAVLVSLTLGFSAGRLWSEMGIGVADAFHRLYYSDAKNTWENTRWLGITIEKFPFDTWIYQELLYEKQPDVILEMGTFEGGSALYFASMLDLIGRGRVISVDIQHRPGLPSHSRITYLTGSSTSDEIVAQIRSLTKPNDKVMVVLDSDHHKAHVLEELRIYSQMVTPGQYLVVEDTNINGHPVNVGLGWGYPGPFEAVREFLASNSAFTPDLQREKFKVTANPGGWLLRTR
jgi:cephalosporin hydroxylase